MTPRLLEPTPIAGDSASHEPISSLSNPRVKAVRKLSRRTERERSRAFLAEGPAVVREAIEAGMVEEVFVTPDEAGSFSEAGSPLWTVTEDVLRSMSTTVSPQGVVARVRMPETSLSVIPGDASLILVLADVRDPGNAGTLLRSAVGAGAGAVVFLAGSVDPFSPKTVRSSAGTIFHIPVATGGLQETIEALREGGFTIVGTEARSPATVEDLPVAGKVALVLGNESWGLSEELRAHLDVVVGIPMPGPAESLNVAVAGSVLLFELCRKTQP